MTTNPDTILAALEIAVERARQPCSATIRDLMTKNVATCGPNDSLEASARIMWDRACGCVPIVDEHGRPISIVTDRDVAMAAYIAGKPLAEIPISSMMSKRLLTVREDASLAVAEQTMRMHAVRRLLVVDAIGGLAGLLSFDDIIGDLYFGSTFVNDPLSAEVVAGTAAALTHRHPTTTSSQEAAR